MPFRIVLVGCGNIAREVHGDALAAYVAGRPGTELAACCDRDPDRAAAFARDFAFARSYSDLDAMLDAEAPQAVLLMAPESVGAALACRIARRGFPLLMEKPPGVEPDQLAAIAAAAEAGGTVAQVAFNRRSMPIVQRLARELEGVAIDHLACEFVRWNRADADFSLTAIHGVDTVTTLARSPWREIELRYAPHAGRGDGVASFHLWGRFASGATASLAFCPLAGAAVERLSVHAGDASWYARLAVRGPDFPGGLEHHRAGGLAWRVAGDELPNGGSHHGCGGFLDEDARFLDDLRAGRPPAADVRTAAQAVAICAAIRRREARLAW